MIAIDTNFVQSHVICKVDKRGVLRTQGEIIACISTYRNEWDEQLRWLVSVLKHDVCKQSLCLNAALRTDCIYIVT